MYSTKDKIILCLGLLLFVSTLVLGYSVIKQQKQLQSLTSQLAAEKTTSKSEDQNKPSQPFDTDLTDNERVTRGLVDENVQEEVAYIKKYDQWPTYTSPLGISFKYPDRLGCQGSAKWEIEEMKQGIFIHTCDGYSGTFEQIPYFGILKITDKEALEMKDIEESPPQSNIFRHDIFGNLKKNPQGMSFDEFSYDAYIPFQIHITENKTSTYFKFSLNELHSYPFAVKKMMDSVKLAKK